MPTKELTKEYLAPVLPQVSNISISKGEGVYIYDENGTPYLDFTSGIGVLNTGHSHPNIVNAIQKQLSKYIFGQVNCVVNPELLELTHQLNAVCPPSIDCFFFASSGAEAVENTVKFARNATGRRNIIVHRGSFHGRTHLAMAMTTSKTIYRQNYEPLPSGIFVTPFPYSYYYGWDDEQTVAFCLKELDYLLKGQSKPEDTAAIIIEPILGEGGYVPAPPAYLQALRKVCDKYGILLVMDEIQSGFGRTGKFFFHEYAGIEPDLLIMAKGMGSGMPISCIGGKRTLMEKSETGSFGGTYGGGNALCLVTVMATIATIKSEGLVENAKERGAQLINGLKQLQQKFPIMGDVRGSGLMIGIEFTDANGNPDAVMASKVQKQVLSEKLIIMTCGTFKNVNRWIPPLVVTEEEIDKALGIYERALKECVKV